MCVELCVVLRVLSCGLTSRVRVESVWCGEGRRGTKGPSSEQVNEKSGKSNQKKRGKSARDQRCRSRCVEVERDLGTPSSSCKSRILAFVSSIRSLMASSSSFFFFFSHFAIRNRGRDDQEGERRGDEGRACKESIFLMKRA